MGQLDAISPNPKRKPTRRVRPLGAQPADAADLQRRRYWTWFAVGATFLVILIVWGSSLPGRLRQEGSLSTAWSRLQRQITGLFDRNTASDRLREINPQAVTPEQLEFLREQLFQSAPNSNTSPAAAEDSNANINAA